MGMLRQAGLNQDHIVLTGLLLMAALIWGFNLLSFTITAVSLPVLAIMFHATYANIAFSGFSSPAWFLIFGIFAITAALTNTGLLYRCIIWMVHRFSSTYKSHTLALTVAGLLLTPVIPSADARTELASNIATDLMETLGYRHYTPEAVGLSMACMLGFGQLSFIFMNGSTGCLLAYGMLPGNAASAINWGSWLIAALPMGLVYVILSWWAIIRVHRVKSFVYLDRDVTGSQLAVLGAMTREEKISLVVIITSLVAMAGQPFFHIDDVLIVLLAFIILVITSVLTENSMRKDIDWIKLLAVGSLVGFGALIKQSGLPIIWASAVNPFIVRFLDNPYLFLVFVALFVHILRFALPLIPALVVSMLVIVPTVSNSSISPFIVMIVILASSNPWFLPYQSTVYQSLVAGTENRLFEHRQTLTLAYLQIIIICLSIIISIPYWRFIGML
jgi:di/tricarboxylate transporter